MSAFTAVDSEMYEDKSAKDESHGNWWGGREVFPMLESSSG
jgi:hypothetical protein